MRTALPESYLMRCRLGCLLISFTVLPCRPRLFKRAAFVSWDRLTQSIPTNITPPGHWLWGVFGLPNEIKTELQRLEELTQEERSGMNAETLTKVEKTLVKVKGIEQTSSNLSNISRRKINY